MHDVEAMDKEFIPCCPDLEGKIRNLNIEESYQKDTNEILIDCMLFNLTRDVVFDKEDRI
eukprot:9821918-Ditylum_brightwellii.AAC.1